MSCSMYKFFIYIGSIVLIVQLWGCNGFEEPKIPMQFTPKAALPIGRASATSFVVKDNAYVTCGRDKNGVYLNDLWRLRCASRHVDNNSTAYRLKDE